MLRLTADRHTPWIVSHDPSKCKIQVFMRYETGYNFLDHNTKKAGCKKPTKC